jgi:hypothetical protein
MAERICIIDYSQLDDLFAGFVDQVIGGMITGFRTMQGSELRGYGLVQARLATIQFWKNRIFLAIRLIS